MRTIILNISIFLMMQLSYLSAFEKQIDPYIESIKHLQNNEFYTSIAKYDLGILFKKDTLYKYSSVKRLQPNRIRVYNSKSPFNLNDFIYIELSTPDFSIIEYGKNNKMFKPKKVFYRRTVAWNYALLFFNSVFPQYLSEEFEFKANSIKDNWEVYGVRKDSADGGSPCILFSKNNGRVIQLYYGQ